MAVAYRVPSHPVGQHHDRRFFSLQPTGRLQLSEFLPGGVSLRSTVKGMGTYVDYLAPT
jgi:hypothetical protein